MNPENKQNEINNNKYLNIPHEDLRFVRVVVGLQDSTVDQQGNLVLNLPDEINYNKRNTTHGTLNGVVSDHLMGGFSQSKYAVIAPLIEMAQNNEMLSMSPADTYFWNKNKGVSIPKATVIAPSDAELPKGMNEQLNIIHYQPDHNDASKNFANMSDAIQKHFEQQNLPFYGVDNRGWIKNNFHEAKMDNGQDTQKVSEALGYKVGHGLHDGTAYSQLEDSFLAINKNLKLLNNINNKEEHEIINAERVNVQQEPSFGEFIDREMRNYQSNIETLPEHQQAFYQENVFPVLKELQSNYAEKLDKWYPEPEMEMNHTANPPLINPLPKGMPPVPNSTMPPIPQFENSNKPLFELMQNYYSENTHSEINQLKNEHGKLCIALQADIERLGLDKDFLTLELSNNLKEELNQKNDASYKKIGNSFQRLFLDVQGSMHLDALIDTSKSITHKNMSLLLGATEGVIKLAPKRDLSSSDLVTKWSDHKQRFFEKSDQSFNTSTNAYQFGVTLYLIKSHLESSPKKSWLELLASKRGYLDKLNLDTLESSNINIKNDHKVMIESMHNAINAPTDLMKEKRIQLQMVERQQEPQELLMNVDELQQQEKTDLFKATENLFQPKPEVLKSKQVEATKTQDFLYDYAYGIVRDKHYSLLAEKIFIEHTQQKMKQSVINLSSILVNEGLSKDDIMLDADNGKLEVGYAANELLKKSELAQKALTIAVSSLEGYMQALTIHQDHFIERLDKIKQADQSEVTTPTDTQAVINEFFKQHEADSLKHAAFLNKFDQTIKQGNALQTIQENNHEIFGAVSTSSIERKPQNDVLMTKSTVQYGMGE